MINDIALESPLEYLKILPSLRVLIAGYGLPAEFGVMELFGSGISPENIKILTHKNDARNSGLHAIAELRRCELRTAKPNRQETIDWVENFDPDLVLSLHYRSRIPAKILNASKYPSINLHPSLLPKYRGTNSVAWAIINGERETGFTFHIMEEEFDTGRIILQQKIKIHDYDTAFSLFHRQITTAMGRLPEVIAKVLNGDQTALQKGDESYFGRQLPFEGTIDPAWPIEQIERFIRAAYFPPFTGAIVELDNEKHEVTSIFQYKKLIDQKA